MNSLSDMFVDNSLRSETTSIVSFDRNDVFKAMIRFYDDNFMPKIVPASELLSLNPELLKAMFHFGGLYVWPTEELCSYMKSQCAGFIKPIEICAGNGALANHNEVTATDSYMQSTLFRPKSGREAIIQHSAMHSYMRLGVPFVKYGSNVLNAEAKDAIKQHSPDMVYGMFVTHKTPAELGSGNLLGVDEDWILNRDKIKKYMVIGNAITHKDKPILSKPHRAEYFPWLVTRSSDQSMNRIFTWEK